MIEIDTALILAFAVWITARIELLCRTQKRLFELAKQAHPELYKKIFGE